MKKIKPFLIITTLLMFVAFAWGIADFAIAEHNGTNKKLYHDESNKIIVKKDSLKNVEFEDFSRGEIKSYTPPPPTTVKEKSKASKKGLLFKIDFPEISYKSFSRAAFVMPKEMVDTVANPFVTADTTKIEVAKADTLIKNE